METQESKSNKFELEENWTKIELSGFGGDRMVIDQVKYFLTIALGCNDENLDFSIDKITINGNSNINENSNLLVKTLNQMLTQFPFLEAAVY
jgi:hypothetical protein